MTATLTAAPAHAGAAGLPGLGEVLSYDRISRFRVTKADVDTVVIRGTDRQHADNLRAAEVLGLGTISDHNRYTDQGKSASQFATKVRDQWLALLDRIRAGGVSHVVVWVLDRAARTTEDTEALLAACRAGGALIVQSATMDVANPHDPNDIFRLKLAGLMAEYEVAKMSMRARNFKAAAAKAGKANGGWRTFGFADPQFSAEDPTEAAAVRAVVARLLAGASLKSQAEWLDAEGFRGTAGGKWSGPNLRQLVMRPSLAGLRVHHGDVLGAAEWDGIITAEDHHRIVHMLSDPTRRTSYTNARAYLLAGLAVCDTCGADLRGRAGGTSGRAKGPSYACATGRHCHRPTLDVDTVVAERTIRRLERLTAAGSLVLDTDPNADALAAVEAALEALAGREADAAGLLAAGTMTAAAYATATTAFQTEAQRLADKRTALLSEAARPSEVLEGMTGPGAREAWEAADLGTQRAVLDVLWQRIALRGGTGRRTLSTEDVVTERREAGA